MAVSESNPDKRDGGHLEGPSPLNAVEISFWPVVPAGIAGTQKLGMTCGVTVQSQTVALAATLPCRLDAGTNPPGSDLRLPERHRAGEPGVTPCRHDGLIQHHRRPVIDRSSPSFLLQYPSPT